MNREKIVLVEDEPDILKTLQVFLQSEGFQVLTAVDGIQGLNMAREEEPDLIILDIMIPKLDGYKVCAMLKLDEKYKRIPIVMFTARAQEADKEIGKGVGADAYITKPFNPETLLTTIKELIKK